MGFGGGTPWGGSPALSGGIPLSEILNAALRMAAVKKLPGGDPSIDTWGELVQAMHRMLGQRNCSGLNVYHRYRGVYQLIAGQGGPNNPYTMGPGGDFDQQRPQKIISATILIDGGPVRMDPMILSTDSTDWASISLQEISAAIPLALFNDRAHPQSNIYLYPQDTGADALEIYSWISIAVSAIVPADMVDLPDGYYDAITKGLAVEAADLHPLESIKSLNYPGYLQLQKSSARAWAAIQSLNAITPDIQSDAPGASRGSHFDWRIGMNR